MPLLASLSRQSTNAAREVRHSAISHLQRILLGPRLFVEQGSGDEIAHETLVQEIFGRILFPLMDELLKPAVFTRDMTGMGETRMRATALLCKAFMHFEVRERVTPVDIRILWVQILDLLDRYMNVDRRGQLVSGLFCLILFYY
jgi:golgi-specific brefeldin A-resistance guanine nucleotide exchange factor 1